MNLETTGDLEYLTWVVQEALRIRTPILGTSFLHLTEDAVIGKMLIRKGDPFQILSYPLHFDKSQWQRPLEFLPERFNHSSPLYLTPDGKKRHTYAYVPFAGGKRVCFGQTFA